MPNDKGPRSIANQRTVRVAPEVIPSVKKSNSMGGADLAFAYLFKSKAKMLLPPWSPVFRGLFAFIMIYHIFWTMVVVFSAHGEKLFLPRNGIIQCLGILAAPSGYGDFSKKMTFSGSRMFKKIAIMVANHVFLGLFES